MGIKSSPKIIYKSERYFWGAWYNKTGDYSVGPATTVFNDEKINKINRDNTFRVLKEHRLENGQYYLE